MSKHTPGPWRVGIPSTYGDVPILSGLSPTYIATIRAGGTTAETAEADAYLVAAAPDLLITLKLLLSYIPINVLDQELIERRRMVQSVVDRAEGR